MPKIKIRIPSINEAIKSLKNGKLIPIYYLFGEDSFSIKNCLELIQEKAKPFLSSDFDKEIFYGDDKSLVDVLDSASAFPFGSEKKLTIFKDFEKIRDKKKLLAYAQSPADFTILVLIHNGNITNLDTELYRKLAANGFIFSAKMLKGQDLITWLMEFCESKGKQLSYPNAQVLIDIVGENRNLLEAQLDKIFVFLGDAKEITLNSIHSLSTSLKEYTIFDLQNNIGKKKKAASLNIALNMLEKGVEPIFIIHMLTRYFTGLSRVRELREKKVPDQAAAKIVGTHPYYYKDYQKARNLFSDKDVYNAVQALLKADTTLKMTSIDNKSLISVLIAEILQ